MKIFAVYRNGVFFGAVKIAEENEQMSVLRIMEAGKKANADLQIKEAPTIPIERLCNRLRLDKPNY